MSYLRLLIIAIMAIVLSACASYFGKHNNNTEAVATVPHTQVPDHLNAANLQNTYAVPPVGQTASDQPLSLVPPGSAVANADNKNNPATPYLQTAPVSSPSMPANSPAAPQAQITNAGLVVKQPYQQVWQATANALTASGYQVVEQDSSLGTYYVADKVSTGGVIKKDTPIYQVHLQANGDATQITLLNSDNQNADSANTQRILGTLRNKLK